MYNCKDTGRAWLPIFLSYLVVESSLSLFISSTRTGWDRIQRTKDGACCVVQFLYSLSKNLKERVEILVTGISGRTGPGDDSPPACIFTSSLASLLFCFVCFFKNLYAKVSLVQKTIALVIGNNIHDWKNYQENAINVIWDKWSSLCPQTWSGYF